MKYLRGILSLLLIIGCTVKEKPAGVSQNPVYPKIQKSNRIIPYPAIKPIIDGAALSSWCSP